MKDAYENKAKELFRLYWKSFKLENKLILDFCCQSGIDTWELANKNDVIHYDKSPVNLALCNANGLKNTTPDYQELADNSLDFVFTRRLHLFKNPVEALQKLSVKMKEYAKIIVVIPFPNLRLQKNLILNKEKGFYSWDFQTIINLLDSCGFETNVNSIFNRTDKSQPFIKRFMNRERELHIVAFKRAILKREGKEEEVKFQRRG